MPKKEVPLLKLSHFLPTGCLDDVLAYLKAHSVQLTITRQRNTILGDYRHKHLNKGHRISVNGNLNKYSFLITLLHELAHLLTYEQFGNTVLPHGKEWKSAFSRILVQFLQKNIFPGDIEKTLLKSIKNPAASSCGDENLLRVLKNYNAVQFGILMVEQLEPGALFSINGDRVFKKGQKMRTRYKCQEVVTGKWFLFSSVYEVTEV
ncbi:MAG: SprT-like domain-containing protein [Ferruginibacter sp.]